VIDAGGLTAPADLAERVDVEELARLLGYPKARRMTPAVVDLVEQSRGWYREHGDPWILARTVGVERLAGDTVSLASGVTLTSRELVGRLETTASTFVVVAAVTAGPEVDVSTARLWAEGRPDEAYVLDRFGVAVAEYLAGWVAGRLAELARAADSAAALPAYSPGYDGWNLTDQVRLLRCLRQGSSPVPDWFEVLPSGMTTPKSSLVALFGVTADRALAAAVTGPKCRWCSRSPCSFRRARYGPAPLRQPTATT